jgi:lysophospholipase L1-like esterase
VKAAGLGLLAVGLASCATTPLPRNAISPGAHYVALGSSYAAGAGIPPLAADRPARCGASQASYSRLLAARLGLTLTDASCGGATTAHLLGAWAELPAQLDAVTPDTALVTITAGGNDLNYMGLMFAASCRAGLRTRGGDAPCPSVSEPGQADYANVSEQLARIVATIRQRAPSARIVLVQYVALVGRDPCSTTPLLADDAEMARRVAQGLATATAHAAERSGAELLPMDAASQAHTPCSANPWSRGLSEGYDMSQGAPWHPTAAGHAAIADMLAARLQPAN